MSGLARHIAVFAAALAAGISAYGQFYDNGGERGFQRWSQVETANYRVIFPRGNDSLAIGYARALERWRPEVSKGIGFAPNEAFAGRMPVVLHCHTADGNGSVTWTPRRMELNTVPDAFAPDPTPWTTQLAIHESRHVAQMQFCHTDRYRPFSIIAGELFQGMMIGLYCDPAMLEGDAVLAETALTGAGRGRSADFLEYYKACFAEGDFRSRWQWRWGSQRLYTPDHYRVGYLTQAGITALYGQPGFAGDYFHSITDGRLFPLRTWEKAVGEATGGLNSADCFMAVSKKMNGIWEEEDKSREPFMPMEDVTSEKAWFTGYTGTVAVPKGLLTVRSGIAGAAELILIAPDGREVDKGAFSSYTSLCSALRYQPSTERVYWSEYTHDGRWGKTSHSDIMYWDEAGIHSLTRGHRYYHPAPFPEHGRLAVTEYPESGGSAAVVLDCFSAEVLERTDAPEGLQIVETAALPDGSIVASCISDDGMAIYRLPGFTPLTQAKHFKIKQLQEVEGDIAFVCDRTGTDELYGLDMESGKVLQCTNTRQGVSDCTFAGDTLYFSTLSRSGRRICKTAKSMLPLSPAEPWQEHGYALADSVSAQFKALGTTVPASDQEISEVKPYSGIAHLFHFHSWVPVFVDYDSIKSFSLESISTGLGIGATGFFQNLTGTMSGYAGWHLARNDGRWRNSARLNLSYQGLYPVIEASLTAGGRDPLLYDLHIAEDEDGTRRLVLDSGSTGGCLLHGSVKAYVPWSWTRRGWHTGLVPQIRLSASNDVFETNLKGMENASCMAQMAVSLRGWAIRSTPSACIYPKTGIGAEAGWSLRPGLGNEFGSNAYAYLYGYLPGFATTHGIRISAMGEKSFGGIIVDPFASVTPRGITDSGALTLMARYPLRGKLTLDYAFPFAPVDWDALCPVAYLRNFECKIHGDCFWYGGAASAQGGRMTSVGAELNAVLGNLAWIPYTTRIGVSFDWNTGYEPQQYNVGLIFSIDL